MLWRTVGLLSVLLQRQNFQVLIGCIPNSAELREGCLGSPLSEDPEFWRAALESALDWGADEFDLPPPAPLHEEEEMEVLPGAGLLHVSGMRL